MEVNKVYNGNCLDVLKECPDNYFDSVVTDPPYGLSFMGKHWDYDVPKVEIWKEIIRVLKPGGHLLCACGTRTQHRMAVNIEDAGFEIRDVITWHYGSGFPKSQNIALAIDKQNGSIGNRGKAFVTAGAGERKDIQGTQGGEEMGYNNPVTDEAKQWKGWGSQLKPATEFWTLARKPLSEKTIADNVLKHGVGGINIDGCRIETDDNISGNGTTKKFIGSNNNRDYDGERISYENKLGRFPANLILDEFMGEELDKQSGNLVSGGGDKHPKNKSTFMVSLNHENYKGTSIGGDEGGASRFFYTAKADNFERNKGLKDFELKKPEHDFGTKLGEPRNERVHTPKRNPHPTVKPIDLMRYLVKLITPKGGIVLDPFNGSGTTGIAAKLELMKYVGIEMDEEYCKISEARIAAWNPDKYKPQQLF